MTPRVALRSNHTNGAKALVSHGGTSHPVWTDSRHNQMAAPGCRAEAFDRDCNSGTRVRHLKILDGRHALPNEETTQGENGDEPARAGLQPEARDADPRDRTPDDGHEGIKCPSFLIRITNKTPLPSRASRPDCF